MSAIFRFPQLRAGIIQDVAVRTMKDFSNSPLELVLGESLYSERIRIKREPESVFTFSRIRGDQKLWNEIHSGLLKSSGESDRAQMAERVIWHYAEEIGGTFDPGVYRFATKAVPWGFNWLLHAASVKRFLPWGMTQALQSRLHILGEVAALQRLSKKGTILLVPTHQSNIDSILIGYVIYLMGLPPFSYGAGLNLFTNPVLSFFMSRLGAFTVDRKKTNAIYKATLKNYSTRILREGIHSIFFPGGGRSRTGAIENHLKLGLLGTGLQAQIEGLLAGNPSPNVYVVPMVTSYHFVLEASSLVEEYLEEVGKHRYILAEEEPWQPGKILNFFWKLFSSQSAITVRIGKPLDIFGNFVDEEGHSVGPNGTTIDPKRWLMTNGELRAEPQRDEEYIRELGAQLVDRFHKENTVLTSHLVAFTFFEMLRKKYPDLDLFRFLRLSLPQRSLPYPDFLAEAKIFHERLKETSERGNLFLSEELKSSDTERWVLDGISQLGLLHDAAVVRVGDGAIWTEDMNLLYYYRNRLTGYGLSRLRASGLMDAKGFLA